MCVCVCACDGLSARTVGELRVADKELLARHVAQVAQNAQQAA